MYYHAWSADDRITMWWCLGKTHLFRVCGCIVNSIRTTGKFCLPWRCWRRAFEHRRWFQSSPAENRSCLWSTRCCDRCVTPFSKGQSFFVWRSGHGRVVGTLVTAVYGGRCLWNSWPRGLELASITWSNSFMIDISPCTVFPVHGDMFPCLLRTKNWYIHIYYNPLLNSWSCVMFALVQN